MGVGTPIEQGRSRVVTGIAGAGDNAIVIETNNIEEYTEFSLMSSDGAMDVDVSLDGTNFAAAISLADLGAEDTTPVIVTAADRIYRFRGIFKIIRVRQAGATAVADAVLMCGRSQ